MTKPKALTPLEAINAIRHDNNGQVVLVLQGGGALGAYQGDVYQALHESAVELPRVENESHAKDIDFSPAGICRRWEAGYADTKRALAEQSWIGEFGPFDGVVLHEPRPGAEPAAGKRLAAARRRLASAPHDDPGGR
jgi:Patatin phospholipase